jgi:hypothetical protein
VNTKDSSCTPFGIQLLKQKFDFYVSLQSLMEAQKIGNIQNDSERIISLDLIKSAG